jgi:hypothetical protein
MRVPDQLSGGDHWAPPVLGEEKGVEGTVHGLGDDDAAAVAGETPAVAVTVTLLTPLPTVRLAGGGVGGWGPGGVGGALSPPPAPPANADSERSGVWIRGWRIGCKPGRVMVKQTQTRPHGARSMWSSLW